MKCNYVTLQAEVDMKQNKQFCAYLSHSNLKKFKQRETQLSTIIKVIWSILNASGNFIQTIKTLKMFDRLTSLSRIGSNHYWPNKVPLLLKYQIRSFFT
jgi:hypothetical protein